MTASIRDDNPVVFFHHYLLTLEHGDVPEGEHVVPLGQANVVREGGDVTIVALGYMVGQALEAAEQLAARGRERRGDRPAYARAARHGDDPDVGREDGPARRRRPVDAARIGGGGDRGGGGVGGLLVAEGAGAARLRARRDDPVHASRWSSTSCRTRRRSSRRCSRCSDQAPVPAMRRQLELLRAMWRIRAFEERVGQLTRANEVHGLVHLSTGQEAVAVGVCSQLRDDDAVYSRPPRARARAREGRADAGR